MKALVTGATGFVGSHLVQRLVAEGAEVIALARASSDLRWIGELPIEIRRVNMSDVDAMAEIVRPVDIVFHVAGLTRGRTLEEYLAVNAEGTARLLDAVRQSGAALRRFVYVSSLAAAGPNPTTAPLRETDAPHPMGGYGQSKLAAEGLCLAAAAAEKDLPVTIVRPPAVYGPRDANFLGLFGAGQRLGIVPVTGSPAKETSFVHVEDLADGLFRAAVSPKALGQTYYIGSGTHTMREVVEAMSAALGRRLRRLRVPGIIARLMGEIGELTWTLTGRPQIMSHRKIRDLLQPRWTCAWDKAVDELGYRPRVTLTDGMRQTAQWYARQGWIAPLE